MTHAVRRLTAAALLCLLALVGAVVVAVPAQAESAYDLEPWLGTHGYERAWVTWDDVEGEAGPGVAFTVNYDASAVDLEAYEEQAEAAAGTFWRRGDYRVERVVVTSRTSTDWSAPGLPPTVVLERADLEAAFGPRPDGLDEAGQGDLAEEFAYRFEPAPFGDAAFDEPFDATSGVGVLAGLVIGFAVLVLGAGLGWLVTFLVMRSRQASRVWGGWGPYVPPAPGYGSPAYAPPGPAYAPAPVPPTGLAPPG